MVALKFGKSPSKYCACGTRIFEAPKEHDELKSLALAAPFGAAVERDRLFLDRFKKPLLLGLKPDL